MSLTNIQTAGELIEALKDFDPDTSILVYNRFLCSVDPITSVKLDDRGLCITTNDEEWKYGGFCRA